VARRPCRHDGPRRCWKEGRAASCQLTTVQYCYDHGFAWLTDSSWVVCTYLSPVPNRAGLARQPMHIKVDARPHPPGSTCCMSLHAAAEMLGDPARKKGRSSVGMDLGRSNWCTHDSGRGGILSLWSSVRRSRGARLSM
jgi:hypothetical protein